MATYNLPYGKTELSVSIPDERRPEIIAPPQVPAHPDPQAEVQPRSGSGFWSPARLGAARRTAQRLHRHQR